MGIAKATATADLLPELRQWMDDTDTNQSDLATLVQCSQPQISKYFSGKATLPLERALKLALVTGIPVEKLLTGPDASRLLKLLGSRSRTDQENASDRL